MIHVKQSTYPTDDSRETGGLLPDAEPAEDLAEHILRIDRTGEASERRRG